VGGDGEGECEEEDDQVSLAGFVGSVGRFVGFVGFVRGVCWEVCWEVCRGFVTKNRRGRGSAFCSESTSEDPPLPRGRCILHLQLSQECD
jgi:hypothetical protein